MSDLSLLESSAVFSPCRRYRYSLTRRWSPDLYFNRHDQVPPCLVAFIGLNPSTADERVNDPTVTRCMGYARRWGFGGMVMLNLFAFRATDPKDMKAQADPVGPANDFHLLRIVLECHRVVCCWGCHGAYLGRSDDVRRMLALMDKSTTADVMCFGLTATGEPKHPLYLRGDAPLQEMGLVTP